MNEIKPGDQLEFDYVNWKGVKAKRRIKSGKLYYGSTKYHIEPQWILRAFDTRKLEFRDFAMKDMHNMKIIKSYKPLSALPLKTNIFEGRKEI